MTTGTSCRAQTRSLGNLPEQFGEATLALVLTSRGWKVSLIEPPSRQRNGCTRMRPWEMSCAEPDGVTKHRQRTHANQKVTAGSPQHCLAQRGMQGLLDLHRHTGYHKGARQHTTQFAPARLNRRVEDRVRPPRLARSRRTLTQNMSPIG